MTRSISIFGATGSIGQNTIDLISRNLESYRVIALTGASNVQQLAADAIKLGAQVAVTAHEHRFVELKEALHGTDIMAAAGAKALEEAASRPVDWAMSAIVGVAGLKSSLTALESGALLALANKESLVCGGELILKTAKQFGTKLLPVDSEHSAIFQCLSGEDPSTVDRIIITASGGAFRDWPLDTLKTATLKQASTHPNWNMGQRITIDSASMFNKALEVIEAKEYFSVSADQIETIIHPESIVHALVGFVDGGFLAHVGPHDMRHAIGYALNWPERKNIPIERLDLSKIAQLNFFEPDLNRYPALRLAYDVMARGGLAGAVFNGAKECALDAFIAGQIGFLDMAAIVEEVLTRCDSKQDILDAEVSFENVMRADQLARHRAGDVIHERIRNNE